MCDGEDEKGRLPILLSLGFPESCLSGKHGPCPICGGKDRFRWDDKEGRGTYFCSQCGAGDGVSLVRKLFNWNFPTAAGRIREILGGCRIDPGTRKPPPNIRKDYRRKVWESAQPIHPGDQVDSYLQNRGLELDEYPEDLRFCHSCYSSSETWLPAMLGLIRTHQGLRMNILRTYLCGSEKAAVTPNRKVMPGKLPSGGAIRLAEIQAEMGIAEGIETALACMLRFQIPVWAAVNASLLEQWMPPSGVKTVNVYGDNDKTFTGQQSAHSLAKRLLQKGYKVKVNIPEEAGSDWADIHLAEFQGRRKT